MSICARPYNQINAPSDGLVLEKVTGRKSQGMLFPDPTKARPFLLPPPSNNSSNSVNSATFSSDYGIVLRNYSLPQITVRLIARL